MKHRIAAQIDQTLVRLGRRLPSGNGRYIGARKTVEAAAIEGLSVCDYVERLWSIEGLTDQTLDQLETAKTLTKDVCSILEIGTGTARFLDKTLQRYPTVRYEVYENASDWAKWIDETYPAIVHPADGRSLCHTPSESIDTVVAYGVFVYLPILVSCRYFHEAARVLKSGGYLAFDAFTESCFDEPVLAKWVESPHEYPIIFPELFFRSFLEGLGFELQTTFPNRCGEGHSNFMVFKLGTTIGNNSSTKT